MGLKFISQRLSVNIETVFSGFNLVFLFECILSFNVRTVNCADSPFTGKTPDIQVDFSFRSLILTPVHNIQNQLFARFIQCSRDIQNRQRIFPAAEGLAIPPDIQRRLPSSRTVKFEGIKNRLQHHIVFFGENGRDDIHNLGDIGHFHGSGVADESVKVHRGNQCIFQIIDFFQLVYTRTAGLFGAGFIPDVPFVHRNRGWFSQLE